jgi:hypothetical protein
MNFYKGCSRIRPVTPWHVSAYSAGNIDENEGGTFSYHGSKLPLSRGVFQKTFPCPFLNNILLTANLVKTILNKAFGR